MVGFESGISGVHYYWVLQVKKLDELEMSRSLLAFRLQDKTDIQMSKAHGLLRPVGWWIQFANKSIQLLDPLPGTYPAGSTGMLK